MAFTINFSLKQQTAIIHFQFDQSDATLRATEVKAKLDKFIWAAEWQNDLSKGWKYLIGASKGFNADLQKKFLEKGFRALDYKISFKSHGFKYEEVSDKFPLYFGNMESDIEEKSKKHFVWAEKGVTGIITSFNVELISILEKHIVMFFQSNNFGTRQNKGFGSFKVELLNNTRPQYLRPSKYFFTISIENPSRAESVLFKSIDLFYRTLRSGINLKGRDSDKLYFKSILFQYAKFKNEQWDKRKIRLDLFGNHPKYKAVEQKRFDDKTGTVMFNEGEPKLYRDMLGLSTSQKWKSYDDATVTKSATGIERFKSPITFKPIRRINDWLVYIIPHAIPDDMKDVEFTIETKTATSKISTPDFNLDEYLSFAFKYFSKNNITIDDYAGIHSAESELEIIDNIYQQLSKQV